MIVWIIALKQRHVLTGPELQHVIGIAPEVLTARVHDDQRLALLDGVLEEGRSDRMVLRRPGADDDDALGILGGHEGRRHRARVDALHQRRHRGGVAEPRAVVDVVGAEAGAHQPSGRDRPPRSRPLAEPKPASAEAPSQSRTAWRPEAALSRASSQVASRKCVQGLAGSIWISPFLGGVLAPDHRLGQAMRMSDVVVAEAAFDAEPVAVGGAVAAVDIEDSCRPST